MNEWPAGWFRDDEPGPSSGAAGGANAADAGGGADGSPASGAPDSAGALGVAGPAGTPADVPNVANEPTVSLGTGGSSGGIPGGAGAMAAGGPGAGVADGPGARVADGSAGLITRGADPGWPQQPPIRSAPGGPGEWAPGQVAGASGGRRRFRPRLVLGILAALVAVILVLVIGGYFFLDSKLTRVNALVPTSNVSAGSNWLISGAPGKFTRQQRRQFHAGPQIDANSDTILLLHMPANGGPAVLVSIPRDSYVPIPGHGMNKINAAFAFGGAPLLIRTVQNLTGLTINHYLNIGYAGLVSAVNAVGGVTVCLKHPLHDRASGLHLQKGCDNLNGTQALGFVRTRHQFASQDLQREQNQRVFIKALLSKMLSPGTLLNPFAVIPAAIGSADALTVDSGTHLYQLVSVAFALRHPETTTVPIANANYLTPAGDSVLWSQAQASQLFHDLKTDHSVPRSLLTGSRLAG